MITFRDSPVFSGEIICNYHVLYLICDLVYIKSVE